MPYSVLLPVWRWLQRRRAIRGIITRLEQREPSRSSWTTRRFQRPGNRCCPWMVRETKVGSEVVEARKAPEVGRLFWPPPAPNPSRGELSHSCRASKLSLGPPPWQLAWNSWPIDANTKEAAHGGLWPISRSYRLASSTRPRETEPSTAYASSHLIKRGGARNAAAILFQVDWRLRWRLQPRLGLWGRPTHRPGQVIALFAYPQFPRCECRHEKFPLAASRSSLMQTGERTQQRTRQDKPPRSGSNGQTASITQTAHL